MLNFKTIKDYNVKFQKLINYEIMINNQINNNNMK